MWGGGGGLGGVAQGSAQSGTWLPRHAGPVRRHPASLQLSIHHLPVRRADCQLGCLDVSQKRHARTPIAPPDSALACPVAPACASAAHPYAPIGVFFPPAWGRAPLACTPPPPLAPRPL